VAEKVEEAEKLLSWQRMKRDEEELGLQILRALSMVVFLVVFMVFFLASPICSCCSRGVEKEVGGKGEGFRWSDGRWLVERWVVFAVERPWSWSAQGLFLYSRFWVSLLRRRGVVGSWWRQRVALLFRFSCPFVPWQPLPAVLAFLAPQDGLFPLW
jgi:hypothetical protein